METKITVIYDNPQDPDTFEAGYPDQLALAKKIPGVLKIETAKVWPKEDGSPTPAYRLLDMYFADYDADLLTKVQMTIANNLTKLRTRSQCCGHPGEPGC